MVIDYATTKLNERVVISLMLGDTSDTELQILGQPPPRDLDNINRTLDLHFIS